MSSESLYLIHTQPDPQRLAAWAASHGLLDSKGDLGYALHALLRAAFGAQAPQPFRYLDAEQGLLAYTRLSAGELTQHAALADAEVAAALGLGQTLHHAGLSARLFLHSGRLAMSWGLRSVCGPSSVKAKPAENATHFCRRLKNRLTLN